MPVITVTVTPTRDADGGHSSGGRGQLFQASVDRTVASRSTTPLLDAARALLADGVPPETRLVMRDAGADHDALVTTVGAAARLTVYDDGIGKPVFRPWQSHPRQIGWSAIAAAPHSAETEVAATTPAAE